MSWVYHSRIPRPCCFSAATTTINGDVILTGSLHPFVSLKCYKTYCYYGGGGSTPYRGSEVYNDCYFLSRDHSRFWMTGVVPPLVQKRCGHSCLTLLDGSVVVLGGYAGDFDYLPSIERLDFSTSQWLPLPPMSVPRSGPAAVIGPGGAIYVAGGSPDGRVGHKSLER